MKTITFDEETNVRYLEFQIEDGFASRASCAEMTFWQTKTAKDEFVEMNSRKYILKIGSNTIESDKGGVKSSKEIDVAPYIVNGSTMIPLRGLLEEMGASIEWNGEDETDQGQQRFKHHKASDMELSCVCLRHAVRRSEIHSFESADNQGFKNLHSRPLRIRAARL